MKKKASHCVRSSNRYSEKGTISKISLTWSQGVFCFFIVIGETIWLAWGCLSFMRTHKGTPLRLCDLLLCSGQEDLCARPVNLSHLVSRATHRGEGVLPASQTMAAVCQMVTSVSNSKKPTAIKKFQRTSLSILGPYGDRSRWACDCLRSQASEKSRWKEL